MPTTTTLLNDDTAAIVTDSESPKRFSWSAAFAGAFVATAVTLFLLTLGSGVGLSLVTVRHATEDKTVTFLTLGAIYFLVAQAFGFAAGGHIVGRMIGPALETDRDEEWRAGTHGIVFWAMAVTATALLVALSAIAGGAAATNGAVNAALASSTPSNDSRADNQNTVTSYWVDVLFRPAPNANQASLAWRRYAQVDNGTASDGTTAPTDSTITPAESTALTSTTPPGAHTAPPTRPVTTTAPAATAGTPVFLDGGTTATTSTGVTTPAPTRSIGGDKAEAGRILTVGMAQGGIPSAEDRDQLARIVSRDTGLTFAESQKRVAETVKRMHEDEVKAAETARKTAAYAALWSALALLFGALVAVASAISARWEDDREHGILPGTVVTERRV
ncbi:MAG: hypothetical protein JO348_02560 [Alphaproteobacteria bacterium]|nr:hypothetical protein [Alphaproteobacteria bacterium]